MSEKLIIRNFGPIKDAEIELRKLTVLIGDQGTGKSTLSKLYAAIYNYAYYDILDIDFEEGADQNTPKFLGYLELFGLTNYLMPTAEIKLDSEKFQFEFSAGSVKTQHPEFYKLSTELFSEQLRNRLIFNYIPAERAFVSLLADALFSLNELGTKLPILFSRFGNRFSSARKEKSYRDYKHLLGADFTHKNGLDSIITQDGKTLALSDASTGMQGTMPLLVVLDSVADKKNKNNNILVIEEPELNLFPETQKKVLEYIITNCMDEGDFKLKLIINTHSPYILTSLNNLMYAYEVGVNEPEKVNKIIPKQAWVNPEDVAVYRLLADGTCKSIIEKTADGTLIDANEIDEVSSIINKEFDNLINTEIALNVEKHQ